MSIRGISGSLLAPDVIPSLVTQAARTSRDCALAAVAFRKAYTMARSRLGPASSARAVFDRIAAPLAAMLGYQIGTIHGDSNELQASLRAGGTVRAVLFVTAWGRDAAAAWRRAVRAGLDRETEWCFCLSGPALRLLDVHRTWSRRFVEFDLDLAADDDRTFEALWTLLHADGFAGDRTDRLTAVARTGGASTARRSDASPPGQSLIAQAIVLSEQYRTQVRSSLRVGVQDALAELLAAFAAAGRRRRPSPVAVLDESLIVVYRILFLLFAEARGLVPSWHPTYRESYTIESLRGDVERLPRPRGLWEALQAIWRLAHRGCRAGSLRVPAFNGRLFSPVHAPLADVLPLDDAAVRRAVLSLTTRPSAAGRLRIGYADLGVEQLGGIYERLLDLEAMQVDGTVTLRPAHRRKTTGSFYTPRVLTDYLVRRTLGPLVADATPEAILSLRILDPAMGSGAFLVSACRYLAAAYETALVRETGLGAADIDDEERAAFRRTIAQRCLYGVDSNPMAVQLARLSLWLATLASNRPLTFLDHHLCPGNSLIGATPDDLARQAPGRGRTGAHRALPLFPLEALQSAAGASIPVRRAIAFEPGDTLAQVREKERALSRLARADAPLARWKAAADLWCAAWFGAGDAAPLRQAFGSLFDELLTDRRILPDHIARPLLERAAACASSMRFFHWPLEFPEVFFTEEGNPSHAAGFDAVLGNPPWEMLRGDRGDATARAEAHDAGARLTAFARDSGIYRLQGSGHGNLYQMFLERSLALLRHGGRLGVVLPSSFALDHGCSRLRAHLLDRCAIDSFVSLENRDGLFPIHRGLRFLLVTATRGGRTPALSCRMGVRSPDALDALPDLGRDPGALSVSSELIARVGGTERVIPDVRSPADLEILSQIAFSVPALGSAEGWNLRFGRELNATDDRRHLAGTPGGLPVVEGKHLQPFKVNAGAVQHWIDPATAAVLLKARDAFGRPRLAYREVAAATNRLTLIAAVIPAGVVTTHTVFCLREPLDERSQHFLCGLFNSFVANYLVRLQVGTHVTAAVIARLPVPRPAVDSPAVLEVARLARRLAVRDQATTAARLQALAAALYGLNEVQFAHVLSTFPLVPEVLRNDALKAFRRSGCSGVLRGA